VPGAFPALLFRKWTDRHQLQTLAVAGVEAAVAAGVVVVALDWSDLWEKRTKLFVRRIISNAHDMVMIESSLMLMIW
jgi:hypothetical protein